MRDWQETNLGQYIKVQGGFAFKSADFVGAGVPVIKIKNVRPRYIDMLEADCVSDAVAQGASDYLLSNGDVVISMTGSGLNAPNSVVGRVARYAGPSGRYLINQRVGRFLIKDAGKVDKRFLFFLLSQKEVQDWLVSNSTGSANQANISNAQIESLRFVFPPFAEQQAIAAVCWLWAGHLLWVRQVTMPVQSAMKLVSSKLYGLRCPNRQRTGQENPRQRSKLVFSKSSVVQSYQQRSLIFWAQRVFHRLIYRSCLTSSLPSCRIWTKRTLPLKLCESS